MSDIFLDSFSFRTINREQYERHLNRLDRDTQTFRFGAPTSRESISMFCDKVFSKEESEYEHLVYGLIVDCLEGDVFYRGTTIAHIHLAIAKNLDDSEISLAVEKKFQGMGLGKLILSNGVNLLKAHDVKRFRMDCLKRNERIVRLVNSLRGNLKLESHGTEISAIVELA